MGGTTGGDQTSDRCPSPRGTIRFQISDRKTDYLQKPLPTGKINGQTRSRCNAEICAAYFDQTAKKEPHRGAPTETSNQSLDPVGHTSVHFAGLSNYSALFARAAFLAARSA